MNFDYQVYATEIDTLTCDPPEILDEVAFLETNDRIYFMEVSKFLC